MQGTLKKTTITKTKSKDKPPKDETAGTSKKIHEDKLKKTVQNVTTPRSYVQKSSTADIYTHKKKTPYDAVKAPKKAPIKSYTTSNVSPMKDILKSSPSTVSQLSMRSSTRDEKTRTDDRRLKTDKSKIDSKSKIDNKSKTTKVELKNSTDAIKRNTTPRRSKHMPPLNVTVNSPIARKKLDVKQEMNDHKDNRIKEVTEFRKLKKVESNDRIVIERQRSKTRTLNENEVKVLKPDVVDNNAEMINLSRKLSAKPKAFYIDLEDQKSKQPQDEKTSDEDISYEDDFESYESDFDSYHSGETESDQSSSDQNEVGDNDNGNEEGISDDNIDSDDKDIKSPDENSSKEVKDDERMLDSGSFDLRESQRSANKIKPAVMDFILEDSEDLLDDKKASLTDEGFQEMSSSSAVSSIKTVHVDILDRPLFIDFKKSKENKRKRRIVERMKQRARDILSMISLHEMSYTLFEMKPIPYDLYMVTFGRSNHTQSAVQTFDDGITEEIQTEDVEYANKWTQCPVEFSKYDICLSENPTVKNNTSKDDDFSTKFAFLVNRKVSNTGIDEDFLYKEYKDNPLRMFFEQKDGVGSDEMLPYASYKTKLKNNGFNTEKLGKFLKKVESRVNSILNLNSGDTVSTDLVKSRNLPFSKGYIPIASKNITDDKLSFVKHVKICKIIFSENKSNLIMTIQKKISNHSVVGKCVICLWDISVARTEPLKLLVSIDNIVVGRFRGSADGIFVAALEDGSIHLWDLSEDSTWYDNVTSIKKPTELVEINSETLTRSELGREWNVKNSHIVSDAITPKCFLQACAYTSSALNMYNCDAVDCTVGLEFVGHAHESISQDGGRKIIGQICALQRIGVLTLWTIIQEKSKNKTIDKGKAYWSKMKLEISQRIYLFDYLDSPTKDTSNKDNFLNNFNLNAAKRRLTNRKRERVFLKKEYARQKSAVNSEFEFDIDRPTSAASVKNKTLLQNENRLNNNWESGIVCNDLKIMKLNKTDNFLVAKNCGEVLCCTKSVGVTKIKKFSIATDASSITCLETSPQGLPYFLAGTDSGTVHLCCMIEMRVLLTLDCRNITPIHDVSEKYQTNSKGRYMGTVSTTSPFHIEEPDLRMRAALTTVQWSRSNACRVYTVTRDGTLAVWELTYSDIRARFASDSAAIDCAIADGMMALLTPGGEVEIHRLHDEQRNIDYLELFQKYVALL